MATAKPVALVTHQGCSELTADDRLLIPVLRPLQIEARTLVWDDAAVDWSAFDQVILRSCWDYHLRIREFLDWISRLESLNVALHNPGSLVRWTVRPDGT